MLCPVCRLRELRGRGHLRQLRRRPSGGDVPQPALEFRDTVLGEHLDALGVADPRSVDPAAVADAIAPDARGRHRLPARVDGGRLVGIFTDRDAVVKVAGKRLDAFDVRDFMTPDPVVLRPDDTLAVAIHKMAVGDFRHIPVVDAGGRPTGVVAAADVFRHIAAALAERRRSRRPRIAVLADDLIWATRLDRRRPAGGGDAGRRCGPLPVEAGLAGADGCVVDLTARAYDGVEALALAPAPACR